MDPQAERGCETAEQQRERGSREGLFLLKNVDENDTWQEADLVMMSTRDG